MRQVSSIQRLLRRSNANDQSTTRGWFVVVFGEPGVGKTCFTDMFLKGEHFQLYVPSAQPESKFIQVGNVRQCIFPIDLSTSVYRDPQHGVHSNIFFESFIKKAGGFVLLYDITDKATFDYITTKGYSRIVLSRDTEDEYGVPYGSGTQRFGCVLVGTKLDLAANKRQVDRALAEQWAETQGIAFYEVDKYQRDAIDAIMVDVALSSGEAEKRDAEDAAEATEATGAVKPSKSRGISKVVHMFRKKGQNT
ncbi:hypothetical protein BU24DRAFT_468700 [Aaosphaeria arxii CBS 175.79]|uniref:P-loop containing nucleoside triphosphate hydrolase protein n=1 Tax=Aaosphaeria arxii CBS 175.79 TaxID=1450172 RepID=A0A6A5X6P2_9PLEO|nr:uncharacterized protein BU24DRAFT_468700 [Aaosphaeria arxii CBS 175.79]KAF2008580.1 hypothetical protein BU24DRAFT_468700 [Aaosphaeria arxii CBS 175.79]